MNFTRFFAYLVLFAAIAPAFGCVGLSAQILHVLVGQKVPAQYDGLKKQRVAVVVTSNFDGNGPDYSMELLTQLISARLKKHVKDIELISRGEVSNAMDSRGFDSNYVDIGKVLRADKMVVVEVSSYSLTQGATLYQGRALYSTRVFDMESGEVRFNRGPVDFAFPKSGQPITDTSERQFEKFFLAELSYRIARYFHDYAVEEEFSRDALIAE